jgi:hypothetical protein
MVACEVVLLLMVAKTFARNTGVRAYDMVSYALHANKGVLLLAQSSIFFFIATVIFYPGGVDLDMRFPWLHGEADSAGHVNCVAKS